MTNIEMLIAHEVRWQLFLHKLLGWTIDMTRAEYTEWRECYTAILDRTTK